MATISSKITINDAMSPALKNMSCALNIMISNFEQLQKASGRTIDTSSIQAARTYLNQAEIGLNEVENQVKNVNVQQEKLNQSLNNGTGNASSFVKAMLGLSAVQKVTNMIRGQLDSAIGRFDTLNNYTNVMGNLGIDAGAAQMSKQMLSEGLNGLPTTLDDAALAVQRFTSANGNIKASTNMFLALNNALLAGGASAETQASALEQISQAYSKGKPDMMEWRSLQTAMPAQISQIAKAMNTTSTQLGEDLRNGKVSMGDFFKTMQQLNKTGVDGLQSFEQQARAATGGLRTGITNMKTAVTKGITDMITNINNAMQTAGLGTIAENVANIGKNIQTVLSNIGVFAGNVITLLSPVFNLVRSIGEFFVNNWSLIAPIIGGISAALLIYNGYLAANAIANGIAATMEGIRNFQTTLSAIAIVKNADATLMATSATYAHTVALAQAQIAQSGYNAALLACPLTWIVVAIIGVIIAIYLMAAAFQKFTGIVVSGTGLVVATISVAGAIAFNTIVGVLNSIMSVVDTVANIFISVIEFIVNAGIGGFNSFGNAVKNILGNVISWVLQVAKVATNVIDTLAGTDFTGKINSLSNNLKDWGKNDNAITIERWNHQIDRMSYTDVANAGYAVGDNLADKVSGLFNLDKLGTDVPEIDTTAWNQLPDTADALNGVANDTGKAAQNAGRTADNTQNIADSLDATEEDLKYLRDLAEQEIINRFTTAEIKIDMTNNNNINSEADLDGIVSGLEKRLGQAMAVAAEGYHF